MRRYVIGNVNIRYNDIERSDEIPFVDNAVKPPVLSQILRREELLSQGNMGEREESGAREEGQRGVPKIATNPISIVILFPP